MAESSSPDITPKEEPITLDRLESPNLFLPTTQFKFTFDEITFTTNNEVALIYPSHPNQEYFMVVLDFISKYSKIWVSTPTREVRGEIGITTFRNALRAHYLPHSSMYVPLPSMTTVFIVYNWILKPNQPEEPPFINHMKAICNLDVPVDSKAPKYSSPTKEIPQGKKPGARSGLKRKQSSKHTSESTTKASNPNLAIQKRKISQLKLILEYLLLRIPYLNNRMEDLLDILKDTRSSFFTPDSPTDKPIIISEEIKEEENAKNDKDTEDTSVPPPSLKLAQSQELIAQPELSKLLASHDFSSCLPIELKELPLKIAELSGEIKELKQHIKDMEIELPRDLKDILSKLETFTSTISVQEKLKTLDSLPGLLKKVTNTLNRFATLVENTSGATPAGVPLADKASASPAKGEKDVDTNLKNELVDILGIDIVTQCYNKKLLYEKYYERMKKRIQCPKIIKRDLSH
ncbi:hypothetical protein Tco_1080556 [Tanacetum coccineum]|uniref:Uncharacterized protein n=1 Tax=Tanacetum coccineum TaxID=301880 RepID=A0ABQ5HV39_9ASTR